jgi:uroporphyrinogen decarboxylase
MTPRERYLATMKFGAPDRIPFEPGWPRKSTRERWYADGLTRDQEWFDVLCAEIGLEREQTQPVVQPGVNFRMMPMFEEKVLEHKDGHYIVQDWMGNITEISDQFDYTYIRNAIDFVTRKWHKFPVENRDDFERMKKRYNPDEPGRYPADFPARVRAMKNRDYVTRIGFSGPFWQLREWCGFEPLCMLFLEDPDFVHEMVDFWTDYTSRTMARAIETGVVDALHLSEDMAYKEKSMISPAMAREFLLPSWTRWVKEAKAGGVEIVDMDSDGKVDELIPLWIEAGIDVCDPIEVAAGNDICAYRRTYGRKIAFHGGIDKRCIAKGGKVIEDELARNAPVVRGGGFIPSCDHGVPPDIAWRDFIHYSRCLAELTGWL